MVFLLVVYWGINMQLSDKLKQKILDHAKQCYPAECCGLIVNDDYIPCQNIASNHNQFEICPKDWAKAEDLGDIQAIVHSHPDGSTQASDLDLHQIELHSLTWVIVSYSELDYADKPDFAVYTPCGYQAPLIGRAYHHGWQDCYAIVRDFYQRELNIALPDFYRPDLWWEDKQHPSLYADNFSKANFVEVENTGHYHYGDVLLCRVGRTEHINHAIIWLGDKTTLQSENVEPCVGNTIILHHPYGRNSVREIFGQNWAERVAKVVRHRDLL